MNWLDIQGNQVLLPDRPRAIIHFLGGAFIAAAPNITYRWLLEELAYQDYLIIATPFVNTFDHWTIARDVLRRFERCLVSLEERELRGLSLPIYGLGHSMGCKVHLLMGSAYDLDRAGNVLMAFNNFEAKRSIPFLDKAIDGVKTVMGPTNNLNSLGNSLSSGLRNLGINMPIDLPSNLEVEFTPAPDETLRLIERDYCVDRNLLVKFRNDDLDQTRALAMALDLRFPGGTTIQRLPGNHLTPLGQDVRWQIGAEFSAIDAMGQWVKQEFYRDLNQLKQEILAWMNPLSIG